MEKELPSTLLLFFSGVAAFRQFPKTSLCSRVLRLVNIYGRKTHRHHKSKPPTRVISTSTRIKWFALPPEEIGKQYVVSLLGKLGARSTNASR